MWLHEADKALQASPVKAWVGCGTAGQVAMLAISCGKPARLHEEARKLKALE